MISRLGAIATVVVVGTALVLGACGGDDDGGDSVEAFSFETDDMCEWVSETELADWVAAEFDWDGTATVTAATDEAAACQWKLESADTADGVVIAGDAARWRDFDNNLYDPDERMTEAGVVEYQEPVEIGAWVVGHPAVSDGVVVHNGGFGQFAFGVPPGRWLWVSALVYDSSDWDDGVAGEEYEARYFAVADRFLGALGWVHQQS